jgi:primary-amine oxidase
VRTIHPLAPLSAEEVGTAAQAALHIAGDGARIIGVALEDPDKAQYLAWRAEPATAPSPPRRARATVAVGDGITELTIDLAMTTLDGRRDLPGAQPPVVGDEYERAAAAVLADERVRRALADRGVTESETVQVDVLPSGVYGHHLEANHRFGRAVFYARRDPGANGYARPIEHLIAYVDLDALEVLELEEGEHRPIPAGDGEYRAGVVPARTDLRPIEITQPEGCRSPSRTAWSTGTAGRWCWASIPRRVSCCAMSASTIVRCCIALRAPR